MLPPQNASLISVNETTVKESMRLNPHVQFYSTIYVISMVAALFLKTIRGLVFVKVRAPWCLPHRLHTLIPNHSKQALAL